MGMDTYREFAELNRLWASGEAPWKVWDPRTFSRERDLRHVLGRPPRARDRPQRLQGPLADAVAALARAEVTGFSRRRSSDPEVRWIQGTVADHAAVLAAVAAARPEVVFHMAGLSTVQGGFEDPVLTYTVNAIGTANVLERSAPTGHTRAVVSVTTDKVYLDQGSEWGYREDDRLGGSDPYSTRRSARSS